jgi:ribosomal protein L30E
MVHIEITENGKSILSYDADSVKIVPSAKNKMVITADTLPKPKLNSTLNFLADLFSTIEAHDFMVKQVDLSKNLIENLRQHAEGKYLWGATIVPIEQQNIAKAYGGEFSIALEFKEPYESLDTKAFHDAHRPVCPICRFNNEKKLREKFEESKV